MSTPPVLLLLNRSRRLFIGDRALKRSSQNYSSQLDPVCCCMEKLSAKRKQKNCYDSHEKMVRGGPNHHTCDLPVFRAGTFTSFALKNPFTAKKNFMVRALETGDSFRLLESAPDIRRIYFIGRAVILSDNILKVVEQTSANFLRKLCLFLALKFKSPFLSLLRFKIILRILNKPFPSCPLPHFQNESTCATIQMKMTLICMKMDSF